MKTKESLKRTYYALTSGALFVIILNLYTSSFNGVFHRQFFYWDIGWCGIVITILAAVWCWSLYRHNEQKMKKWWIGAIPVLLLLLRFIFIQALMALARHNQEFINIEIVNCIFFGLLALYTMAVTFSVKNIGDYRNLLPTKANTSILKWLFIVFQILVWAYFIMILPKFINDWFLCFPTEELVKESINQMNAEFEQVGF